MQLPAPRDVPTDGYRTFRVRTAEVDPLVHLFPLASHVAVVRLALAALREKLVAEGRLPA